MLRLVAFTIASAECLGQCGDETSLLAFRMNITASKKGSPQRSRMARPLVRAIVEINEKIRKQQQRLTRMQSQVMQLSLAQAQSACNLVTATGAIERGVALDDGTFSSGPPSPAIKLAEAGSKLITWGYRYRIEKDMTLWPKQKDFLYMPMLKTDPDVTQSNLDRTQQLPGVKMSKTGLLILNEWENFDPSAVTAFCGNSKYSNLLSKTTTCVVSPGITGNLTTMLDYLNAYKACFTADPLKWNAVSIHFYQSKNQPAGGLSNTVWAPYFGLRGIINGIHSFSADPAAPRQLWLTEFALNGYPSELDQLQFMCLALCGMYWDLNIQQKVDKYAWFAGNAPSGDPTLQNQELFKNGMVTKLGCFYSSFDPHQGCGKLAQPSDTNDPNNMGNGYDGAIILQKIQTPNHLDVCENPPVTYPC